MNKRSVALLTATSLFLGGCGERAPDKKIEALHPEQVGMLDRQAVQQEVRDASIAAPLNGPGMAISRWVINVQPSYTKSGGYGEACHAEGTARAIGELAGDGSIIMQLAVPEEKTLGTESQSQCDDGTIFLAHQ